MSCKDAFYTVNTYSVIDTHAGFVDILLKKYYFYCGKLNGIGALFLFTMEKVNSPYAVVDWRILAVKLS